MIQARPPAEVAIDAALVRALLDEQHPDLALLPIADAGEGWDNRLFRLGADLLVRLPRRAAAAANIDRELQWLPQISPGLPLRVPAIQRAGRPGRGYPWSWSIVSWIAGEPALSAPPADPEAAALALGGFLRALHKPAPPNAPPNPVRSVPLSARSAVLREHLDRLQGVIDQRAILDLWQDALDAPGFTRPPVWIHGDLHPANLIVENGRLSGVIDFGDLAAGDPATDLAVAWMMFPPDVRPLFLTAAGYGADAPLLTRARGWALALGVALAANSADDPRMSQLGHATLAAVLEV